MKKSLHLLKKVKKSKRKEMHFFSHDKSFFFGSVNLLIYICTAFSKGPVA